MSISETWLASRDGGTGPAAAKLTASGGLAQSVNITSSPPCTIDRKRFPCVAICGCLPTAITPGGKYGSFGKNIPFTTFHEMTMTKTILDVGNCGPDHASIRSFLTRHFDCSVAQSHGVEDTLSALREGDFALVLVNRKLDRDYSDGIEIIRAIKSDAQLARVPVMLVTNYAEHQDAAVALGAERGFGKLEFDKSETIDRLRPFFEASS